MAERKIGQRGYSRKNNSKVVPFAAPKTGAGFVPVEKFSGSYSTYPTKTKEVVKIPSHVYSLLEMLEFKRSSGSVHEKNFISKFIDPIEKMQEDHYGNRYLVIPDGKLFVPVMFSCHTDTMHRSFPKKGDEKRNPKQIIKYADGFVALDHKRMDKGESNCLGADDGAGLWLMLEMIKNKVPGTYVFHRDEEIGRLGSRYMARQYSDWARSFKAAIAFDRRGKKDIITHQSSERTCSDEFADSLAKQISYKENSYEPSKNGSYTDTASYSSLIPECTNISVGYYDEHGPNERLDLHHLIMLRSKLVNIDTSKLAIKRDPTEREYDSYYGYGRYYGRSDAWSGEEWYSSAKSNNSSTTSSSKESTFAIEENIVIGGDLQDEYEGDSDQPKQDCPPFDDDFDEDSNPTNDSREDESEYKRILTLVRIHPELIAEYLWSEGITSEELGYEIERMS